MSARSEFRQALRDRDVPLLRKAWAVLFPDEPQPVDEREATAQMHIARTMQGWMRLEERAYSHFWLKEHGLPSLLPKELLPKAEQYRPDVNSAVGLSVKSSKDWLKPALPYVLSAMQSTVLNHQELIEGDPERLKDEVQFARRDEFKRLFGVETATEVER